MIRQRKPARDGIDRHGRLEMAGLLDRDHLIDVSPQAARGDRILHHGMRAIGEDHRAVTRGFQPPENLRHIRKGIEHAIGIQQGVAQGRIAKPEARHREIQRAFGQRPEIGAAAAPHRGQNPAVFELLLPPQGGEFLRLVAQRRAGANHCGVNIEESAIGVKHEDASQGSSA